MGRSRVGDHRNREDPPGEFVANQVGVPLEVPETGLQHRRLAGHKEIRRIRLGSAGPAILPILGIILPEVEHIIIVLNVGQLTIRQR